MKIIEKNSKFQWCHRIISEIINLIQISELNCWNQIWFYEHLLWKRVVWKEKNKKNIWLREKSPPLNDTCFRINVLRRFDTNLLEAPWRWLRFYFEFTDFSRLLGWDLRIIFRGNDFRLYSSTFISLLDQYIDTENENETENESTHIPNTEYIWIVRI